MSNELMSLLQQQLGNDDFMSQLSQQIGGADPNKTRGCD